MYLAHVSCAPSHFGTVERLLPSMEFILMFQCNWICFVDTRCSSSISSPFQLASSNCLNDQAISVFRQPRQFLNAQAQFSAELLPCECFYSSTKRSVLLVLRSMLEVSEGPSVDIASIVVIVSFAQSDSQNYDYRGLLYPPDALIARSSFRSKNPYPGVKIK